MGRSLSKAYLSAAFGAAREAGFRKSKTHTFSIEIHPLGGPRGRQETGFQKNWSIGVRCLHAVCGAWRPSSDTLPSVRSNTKSYLSAAFGAARDAGFRENKSRTISLEVLPLGGPQGRRETGFQKNYNCERRSSARREVDKASTTTTSTAVRATDRQKGTKEEKPVCYHNPT